MESYYCCFHVCSFQNFQATVLCSLPQSNCKVTAQHNAGVYKQENSNHTFFFFPGGGAGGQGQPKTLFQIQFKMCMSLCVLFLLHTQKLQTIFMYGTFFHMGKSLMGIIRLKRAGRLCQEMV